MEASKDSEEIEMPDAIRKLHLCFARLRRSTSASSSAAASTSSRAPLRPKQTTSSAHSATCSSASSPVLFKNFNSLYDPASSGVSRLTTTTAADTDYGSDSDSSMTTDSSSYQDDLSAAIASRRFHLSSPGRSNSIVDGYSASTEAEVLGVGVAVRTYSCDPYWEFRRSMEEMAASMGLFDPREHGGCLHELLLCYLALNRRHSHDYIIRAFADLLSGLRHHSCSKQGGIHNVRPPHEHDGENYITFVGSVDCSPPAIEAN